MDYLLNKKMKELIHDPDIKPEQLIQFEERIRENGELAEAKMSKSLYLLMVVSAIWFLIRFTAITKINLSIVEIEDLSLLLFVIPPVAAFLYYQYALSASYISAINGLLFEYYSQTHQPIEMRNLIEFTFGPSIMNIESIFLNVMDKDSLFVKFGKIWISRINVILIFLPILFQLWMLYLMLTSPFMELWLSALSSMFVIVFIFRGYWVLSETSNLYHIPQSYNEKDEG